MFKCITVGIIAFVASFGSLSLHANNLPHVDDSEEQRYITAIKKEYPESDDRHKFVSAMQTVGALLSASAKDDFYLATRIFPVVKPFLESHNTKIKLCAETILRLVKLGLKQQLLLEPPDETTPDEVRRGTEEAGKAYNQMMDSYSDFLRTCIPEQ